MDANWVAKDILTISEFFSLEECSAHIVASERGNYEEAPVSTGAGMVIMKDVRNNDRLIVDDAGLADDLWQRLGPFMPCVFKKKWQPVGVNERFRYYRYDIGQKFDWHTDGYYERENGERSFFTFMVYLNDSFEGGETAFTSKGDLLSEPHNLKIKPKAGMALLFHHPILHIGEAVRAGRKYVLRTDVMFGHRLKRVD